MGKIDIHCIGVRNFQIIRMLFKVNFMLKDDIVIWGGGSLEP